MLIIAAGAAIIGLTLGLLGSGGSAITVPVLVYLVGHHAKQSIAESMAIVGLISIAAAIPYGRANLIDWRSVWYFGMPGMAGTLIGALLGGMSPEALQLAVFGLVLVAAAAFMLRGSPADANDQSSSSQLAAGSPVWKIAMEGTLVGVVTGFVGVGGGFLIVPALVIFGKLPMRIAIGTSLVIIVLKSAIGFAKYQHYLVSQDMSVDGMTLLLFTGIGIVGSLAGRWLNTRMNPLALKRSFAAFLILLGGWVIIHEGSKFLSVS
jgi:uncharacterized membrane protein YfcA